MAAARSEAAWLDEARLRILRGQWQEVQLTLEQALAEYPGSKALRRAQAAALQQAGRKREAESLLQALLETEPADSAAAFALARLLADQGRVAAAAAAIRRCLAGEAHRNDADLAIAAIELLDDCDRKRDAADVAAAAIAVHPDDARLHAYAGMLQIQMGDFEMARRHYRFALEHDARAWEWHVPIGLSSTQRYRDHAHADFASFEDGLRRGGLSDKARAELHFALGKAYDDVGRYAEAAQHFRDGNAILHRLTAWSRKAWRRAMEARLAAAPFTHPAEPAAGFNPIFIVGIPRSGTTLLAELLSLRPGVCNRGELPWLAHLAMQPDLSGQPDAAALQRAAATYIAHARRDDAGDARWFIDKQPLNFRYLDLLFAMFPGACVIHCQRGARDTALSLWTQCFLEDVQGYSYDFNDIALVMHDCARLMAHWCKWFPDSIRNVRYEDLASDPDRVLAALAAWIGLPATAAGGGVPVPTAISSASLWQARQPVHTRSVNRAERYLPFVPELARWPAS